MSSSPGQGKECLPPKKRESRQGSTEQGPSETFKRPAPPWERMGGRRAEHRADLGEDSLMTSCYGVEVPPPMTPPMTPPLPSASPQSQPIPAPTPMYTLPWHIPYPATMATPFVSSPGADSSLVWRGHSAGSGDTMDLSWSRPVALQHAGVPIPYGMQFPTDSVDVLTCLPPRQRNYSGPHSQITHAQLFSRASSYSRELRDKTGLPVRRPNGFDRRDGWYSQAGKSFDQQGNGRPGWGTTENSRCERKSNCHEYRQPPTQAFSGDAKNAPLPQGKDLWVKPRPPPAKSSEAKGIEYDFPAPLRPAGHGSHPPPLPPCAGSQQRPPDRPRHTTHTALRNSELSHLLEKRDTELPRSPNDGPNGTHPRQGLQRTSCPTSRGHDPKGTAAGPLHPPNPPSPPHRPPVVLPHFQKGSLIELGGGRLKRVEEMQTEDFLLCPDPSPDIHLSSCTVLMISPSPDPAFSRLQVLLPDYRTQELLEVLLEYPFFVRDRGWSSCCPRRTAQLYELRCHQLRVGDVCLALTPSPARPPSPSLLAAPLHAGKGRGRGAGPGPGIRNRHSRAEGQKRTAPSPPPAPLRESPRKRRRRWSAPELQGASMTPTELPHSPKHRRQQ